MIQTSCTRFYLVVDIYPSGPSMDPKCVILLYTSVGGAPCITYLTLVASTVGCGTSAGKGVR